MSYSVECVKCNLPFTKRSMKSKQKVCHDCLYDNSFTTIQNARYNSINQEMSKGELLAKINVMDEKMDTVAQTIETLVKDSVKKEVDVASLEHGDAFIDLKASIVSMQKEHEEKIMTLLATVNSRMVSLEKRVTDRVTLIRQKIRELRHEARQRKWSITEEGWTMTTKL